MSSQRAQMRNLPIAIRFAKWGAILGLICGVLYSVGGFFVDLFTTGLNQGTALAFGALVGMPALFAFCGLILGVLIALAAQGVRAIHKRSGSIE